MVKGPRPTAENIRSIVEDLSTEAILEMMDFAERTILELEGTIAELRAEVNRQDRKVLDMQLEIDALTSELEYVTMTDDHQEMSNYTLF
jgi:uncharacterized coiled-coil protein SlyX